MKRKYFRSYNKLLEDCTVPFDLQSESTGLDIRKNALIEVLRRISEDDYQKLNEKLINSFSWHIPDFERLGKVDIFPSNYEFPGIIKNKKGMVSRIIFLSPLLERLNLDLSVAIISHELAHIILSHDVMPGKDYWKQEDEAWDKVRKWGFTAEEKKYAEFDRNRSENLCNVTLRKEEYEILPPLLAKEKMESNIDISSGPLSQIFQDIFNCKQANKCPSLETKQFFFEPNPSTLAQWNKLGIYSQGIDPRIVFVGESPGPSADPLDFPNIQRCWSLTSKDQRFEEVRKKYGLQNCFITNTVMCGVRDENHSRHSDSEIGNCIGFLLKELEIIKPKVVVAVGGNSAWTIRKYVLPRIREINFHQITHYSARRNPWDYWKSEFPALLKLIR